MLPVMLVKYEIISQAHCGKLRIIVTLESFVKK